MYKGCSPYAFTPSFAKYFNALGEARCSPAFHPFFTPGESMIIPLDHVGDDVRISVYLKAYVLCLHWFM